MHPPAPCKGLSGDAVQAFASHRPLGWVGAFEELICSGHLYGVPR